MGMNRHDAYYEPENDYMDSDELQAEVADLMKDEYNPCKWLNFLETFEGKLPNETVEQLEEMMQKRDFEAFGRKLWNLSYEYWEDYATGKITGQY
jgi:hypothetical protein